MESTVNVEFQSGQKTAKKAAAILVAKQVDSCGQASL